METEHEGLKIYTIGHGNVADVAIVELLRNFEIQVLVDVRTVPYSQYTHQFNREVFANTLKAAGIEYKFAGQFLGGRPDDPTCYKSGKLPEDQTNYLELVDYAEVAKRDWYQKGIGRLIAIAEKQRTAIMCSEEDPNRCHRHHLITQTLMERNITVCHIRGNGDVKEAEFEPKQLNLLPEG